MPLTMAEIGVEYTILKVSGSEKIKKYLENLGFVAGSKVTVLSKISGNIVVSIKDARIALNKETANKIFI